MEYCSSGSLLSVLESPENAFGLPEDEFLVVLQGQDYRTRESQLSNVRRAFERTAGAEDREPWQRYSAAVGMSVLASGDDVEAVFNRADQQMYEEKKRMKAE